MPEFNPKFSLVIKDYFSRIFVSDLFILVDLKYSCIIKFCEKKFHLALEVKTFFGFS